MLNRACAFFAALVLCWQIGLPQGLLQTVAWGWMITTYSQEDGLKEGLRKTFDGNHPCGLCERIAQARPDTAPTSLAPITPAPFDFLWTLSSITGDLPRKQANELFSSSLSPWDLDPASPLLPPPRA